MSNMRSALWLGIAERLTWFTSQRQTLKLAPADSLPPGKKKVMLLIKCTIIKSSLQTERRRRKKDRAVAAKQQSPLLFLANISFQGIPKTWCSQPFYFAFQCAAQLRKHNACQQWKSRFSKAKFVQKLCFVAYSTLWVQFCFVKLQMRPTV